MLLRRALLCLLMASGMLLFAGVGIAGAHFLSEDSVDGREIRYEDYTKWDDSRTWGEARWEALPDGVTIAPDSAGTIADLEIRDYNANDGRCGYWDGRTGADLMALNDRVYNNYSTTNRRACTLHEWGHAHRLAHSYDNQVMDDCPVSACGSVYTYPQSHDTADYNQIW
jgi:hypothetical protein